MVALDRLLIPEEVPDRWLAWDPQATLVPPAVVVERDAPDEVPPAWDARRLPASRQGQEV